MLRELHIHNLAVIEDATIELRGGLNCFTGQTGAGKSLVIGAFEVMLGLRAAGDMLRAGAEEGRVSGVFELSDCELIERINQIADVNLDAGGDQLLITRKLFASGRTSVSINGQPATAAMLRDIGQLLVDVHGQHDHQFLLRPGNQLLMLDRFAECEELRSEFAHVHRQLRELQQRRVELEASATLRRQQLELYEFQAEEIDQAELIEGEYDELNARHRLLSNLQTVRQDVGAAYAALYESDGAVLERLQALIGLLNQTSEIDEELSPIAQTIRDAAAQIQDAAFDLSRYINRLDLDPAELEEVTQRLNTLNRMIHKYGATSPAAGGSIEDVIAYRQQIEKEIQRLHGESEDLASIDRQIAPLRDRLRESGASLTKQRKAAAKELAPLVEAQLAELGMSGAKFEVTFEALDEQAAEESTTGFDAVEIIVQPNPGQPARPLRKIASGGELSRIMLGVKAIAADADRVSVLVFDEIDANVGGRMGDVIGGKLRQVASHHQVLCITHLPQIAAYADHHLKITKTVADGQTRTRIAPLTDHDSRINELAEMLTGKNATATTRKQAEELMKIAGHSTVTPEITITAAAALKSRSKRGLAKSNQPTVR